MFFPLSLENKAPGVMKPGHVFTIEPMINAGSWRDQLWPDNWTAVTEVSNAAEEKKEKSHFASSGRKALSAIWTHNSDHRDGLRSTHKTSGLSGERRRGRKRALFSYQLF
jgi:methionine aminopeptidase